MDCDGVIWRGNQAIPGAKEVLENLENQGYHLGFVTNNSSLSRKGFYQKFVSLGFHPEKYLIINSGYGAAVYLNNNKIISFMRTEKEDISCSPWRPFVDHILLLPY
ncbi:hypothetical protein CEE45_13670 [Candidatus Heimdallarchaeota archaeon B3_Heim]|nr:MAG: hypothetical protein CEE45_13670 [Candidatus Heimdallarchaeota archaeon B3_Heim]